MQDVYHIREAGDKVVIQLMAGLDNVTMVSLRNRVRTLATRQGKTKLTINCAQLSIINSTLTGMFVRTQEFLTSMDGYLNLCCVNSHIYRTFDLIGVSEILPIFDTEEEALAHL